MTAADQAAARTAIGLGTLATQSGTFSGTSSGTNTGDQDLSGYLLSSTAASTYVPYTGATGAVNLGTNALTVGAVTASGSVVCPNGNTLSPALRIGSQGNSGFWTNASTNTLYLNFDGTTYHRFYNSHHYLIGAIGFGSVSSPTAFFSSDAANTYNFRNSTNPQSIELEGTYTSATNREYLKFRAVAGANFEIGPANGSAGGTLRGLTLGGYTNDSSTITPWLQFSTTGNISGPLASAWTIAAGTPVQAATTTAGNNLTIQASSAVAGSSTNGAAAGGSVFIYGGNGTRLNTGTAAGGDITIRPGTPSIGGTPGTLYLTGALGTTQSAAGDVRITGGTATQTNNNLQMGHVYIATVGSDNYFFPGTIQLSTGFGSQNTNAGGAGGAGGNITQTTGYGGSANTGSGIKTGGAGGAFTFTTGYGGASSSGTTSNTGGNGGAYNFTTGVGGVATGTAATGGNGGAFTIATGAGGAGATTNGNGGNITLTAGIAGAGAGAAGVNGTITFNQGGSNKVVLASTGIVIGDAVDLVLNATTGTKIGTATTQKLAFWNATPIVQPTTAVSAATRTGGGGATVTDTDTFDGYTIAQIVKALRNLGALA